MRFYKFSDLFISIIRLSKVSCLMILLNGSFFLYQNYIPTTSIELKKNIYIHSHTQIFIKIQVKQTTPKKSSVVGIGINFFSYPKHPHQFYYKQARVVENCASFVQFSLVSHTMRKCYSVD